MIYADFSPYILPLIGACPSETMAHHVRLAAIDFCRRTQAWRMVLDPVVTSATVTQYTLAVDENIDVNRLVSVYIGGSSYEPVDLSAANQIIRRGGSQRIAWTTNRIDLNINPAPATGLDLIAEISLQPSLDSTELPDEFFDHYAQDIAAGALANLLAMPKADWRDKDEADRQRAMFEQRVNVVGVMSGRGFTNSQRATNVNFF